MTKQPYQFILGRNSGDSSVNLWKLDLDDPKLLVATGNNQAISIDQENHITPAGKYLLEWGPGKAKGQLDYVLHDFEPDAANPFGDKPVQKGSWNSWKFFHGHLDFGHYGNKHKDGPKDRAMKFISMGNFLLAWVPEPGRGNYHLWNFDPASADPLQPGLTPDGAWGTIQSGHHLIGIDNYVIDWVPEKRTYRLLSFDPQERNPVRLPVLKKGKWADIDSSHELVPLGDYILDWVPSTGAYRLWKFTAKSKNPLGKKPVKSGKLPEVINDGSNLTGMQPIRAINAARAVVPGTTDYMRSKIKHVVYYMIENRSFDHVCGWLYDNKDIPAQIIGPNGAFKGARLSDFNLDADGKKIPVSVYEDGKLSKDFNLELLPSDPHHDNSDVLRQLFNPNEKGYRKGAKPNMGGFVLNNGLSEVMVTYSPTQLPVLNGLAKNFAVSDEWFCSMPGGTDVNRAFSLTGSSFGLLDNFQNGVEYSIWPKIPHRPSIWKTLWSNGITDWKIYNSIEWFSYVFTYHLFLQGQIPSVDKNIAEAKKAKKPSDYISSIDQFKLDARNGTLPAFSYLEPVWIAKTGTTSYHPGADLVPGEENLNELFDALQAGPNWDETLLIITFDEHGGIFDHVPPPFAAKPWPNDKNNGFDFDIMGVRVPTILVSPMIGEKTIFRAEGDVPYDATSFLATLLNWFGVPKSRWGLGERTKAAPTFESVINLKEPRSDRPKFVPPYDKTHPVPASEIKPHDLHRTIAHRLVMTLGHDHMQPDKLVATADDISGNSKTMEELHDRITEFHNAVEK